MLKRQVIDKGVHSGFLLIALFSITVLSLIVLFLFKEGIPIFEYVSIKDFVLGQYWYPTDDPADFGIFPLILGSVSVTLLSGIIAIPLGIIAASNHTKPMDFLVMIFSQLGIAIPNFWFALLLIIIFSVFLGVLPAGGFAGWDAGIVPALLSLLLPTIALALPQSAILTRVTRSSLLEVLKEDYIRTARAKGSSRRRTLWRHALRNAMIPVVTIMGLQFSFLLAGTIIIENVFYLPGIGRLIFQAIAQRDLIVVKNLVILLAGSVIIINFIVDMLYAVIDPRLRGEKNV